jgi:hypothetical protein
MIFGMKRIEEWVELTEKTFNFATYAGYWFQKGGATRRKLIYYAV